MGLAYAYPDGTLAASDERRDDPWRVVRTWRMGEGSGRAGFPRRGIDEGEQVGQQFAQPEQVFAEF